MATIGKVRAVFTANASGLTGGVNQAAASLRKMERTAAATAKSMRSLVTIQGAQLFGSIASAVGRAASSMLDFGKAEAETIDRTSKLAARLGMTYGEMAGLSLAGDLAGVSMDSIATAATKADVAFVKAAGGSKEAKAAFDQIGLSLEQLNGKTAAERFDMIVQAMSQLPSEAERSAAAVALFGRAGAELLPMFAEGAAGLRAAREEAERMGLALTSAQGRDVEGMNDAFTRVWKTIQGITQQVVAHLAPTVKAIADTFTNFVQSYGGSKIGQGVAGAIIEAGRYLAGVADYLVQSWPAVVSTFSEVVDTFKAAWEIAAPIVQGLLTAGKLFLSVSLEAGSFLVDIVGRLLNAAGEIAAFIPGMGGVARNVEKAGEGMMRAAKGMDKAAVALFESGLNDLGAIGSPAAAKKAGENMARPFSDAFEKGLKMAQESAANPGSAPRVTVDIDGRDAGKKVGKEIAKGVQEGVKQGVKGLETNSQEGLREMFRILRGDTGNSTQERIADATERIADNTENIGDGADFDVLDLAPAAGG